MKYTIPFIILTLFLHSCKEQHTQNSTPIYHASKEEKKQGLPFSDAVEFNKLLFLSGQIGMDHQTRTLVSGGVEAETAQALENIKAVLKHNGSSLDQVVKCTVILADIQDFQGMNTVYRKYFTHNLPARTTFAASLVRDAKIEIEVIAVKK